MNVGGVNSYGPQPERPEDADEAEKAKSDASIRPTRRPSTTAFTTVRAFRDNYPPSPIRPSGLPVRAQFPDTGADAIRSGWGSSLGLARVPAEAANEFGMGATVWTPKGAESTSSKTWAVNSMLPPLAVGPGYYLGVTRQVARFPPTAEYPDGTQWTRTTAFVDVRSIRASRTADTVPGFKVKLAERTRWQDLSYQTLWQRIKEKAVGVFSKDSR